MPPRFPSISLVPGGATQEPASKAEWGKIKGALGNQIDLSTVLSAKADVASTAAMGLAISELSDAIALLSPSDINRKPIVQDVDAMLIEASSVTSGNVLIGATDQDGDVLVVSSITYGGVQRTLGSQFSTTHGSMVINANGSYTYQPGPAAWAINVGQSSVETFGFSVYDGQGGSRVATLRIMIIGTDSAPVLVADVGSSPHGTPINGNVLANDLEYEAQAISVTSFTVTGVAGSHAAGTPVVIPGFGSFSLAANGDYNFTPADSNVHGSLLITYTATDGSSPRSSTLSLSIAPPPPTESDMQAFYASYREAQAITRPATNPPPARPLPDRTLVVPTASYAAWNYSHRLPNQSGRPANALDFEVGPDKPYTDINQVPWELLLPGDRVFIHYRATPYKRTIVINSSGTADAWIEVIGVRDPVTGAMPVLDGDGAICALGQHTDVYDGAALIAFGHMTTGVYGMVEGAKPRFIHVTGLELRNAHPTKTRTRKTGVTSPWGEFGSAFYGIGFDNVCIQGNRMHHCGLGIFVNSILAERFQSRNLHICNNWFYECSSVGSYSTHSAYSEAIGTIYEHNYIQRVMAGSNGDTVKDRSVGVVFRYNYIEVSANGIALRDPSSENPNQNGWLEAQAVDSIGELMINSAFVYGNTFISRQSAPQSIVVTGDGANAEYRQGSLYFYSNVVASIVDGASGYTGIYYNPYRIPLFGLPSTRSPITVVARNNLFYTDKATEGGVAPQFGIFYWQGLADFQSNWINDYLDTAYDTAYVTTLARGQQFNGAGLGGLTESSVSPGFTGLNVADFSLLPSSPFFGLNAALPSAAVARDLTPVRRSVMYPFDIAPVPSMVAPPIITGNQVRGNTLSVGGYAFSPLPDSYLFQWYRDGVAIAGAVATTYQTVLADESKAVTVGVRPVNVSAPDGGPESVSVAINIVTPTAPVNTVAPVIAGSGQVTFEHSVSSGTWTNDPISYSYQAYLNGVAAYGETLSTFTPSVGDIGKTLQWMVTATNAGEESSFAMSNTITLAAVSYDPDNAGRWNFGAADGTTLRTLSASWNGIIAPYNLGFGQDDMTCQGGILRPTGAYTLWNLDRAWLENGQGDNVSVEASMVFTAADRGFSVGLRQTAGQHYAINVGVDGIRVTRNGTSVSEKLGMVIASPATLKVVPTGGVLNIYVNGVLEHTYTDDSPLVGGFPGVVSYRNGVSTLECGMNWWTDNPQ